MTYIGIQPWLWFYVTNSNLHCSNLYELLEQNGSFHQVLTEAQLSHHPVLHLVEATHKPLQVSCDGTWEFMTAEYVVDKLHLERGTMNHINYTRCEKRIWKSKTGKNSFYR